MHAALAVLLGLNGLRVSGACGPPATLPWGGGWAAGSVITASDWWLTRLV
jgi:hypothetical protein